MNDSDEEAGSGGDDSSEDGADDSDVESDSDSDSDTEPGVKRRRVVRTFYS